MSFQMILTFDSRSRSNAVNPLSKELYYSPKDSKWYIKAFGNGYSEAVFNFRSRF